MEAKVLQAVKGSVKFIKVKNELQKSCAYSWKSMGSHLAIKQILWIELTNRWTVITDKTDFITCFTKIRDWMNLWMMVIKICSSMMIIMSYLCNKKWKMKLLLCSRLPRRICLKKVLIPLTTIQEREPIQGLHRKKIHDKVQLKINLDNNHLLITQCLDQKEQQVIKINLISKYLQSNSNHLVK